MAYDTCFGPGAQPPEQRALMLAQLHSALSCLKINAPAMARQLWARYIAGKLSWLAVHKSLYANT